MYAYFNLISRFFFLSFSLLQAMRVPRPRRRYPVYALVVPPSIFTEMRGETGTGIMFQGTFVTQ